MSVRKEKALGSLTSTGDQRPDRQTDGRTLLLTAFFSLLLVSIAPAATYTIHPTDTPKTIYTTIEAAACGDTVNIQAGTYSMATGNLTRVYLTNKVCTATFPLLIRAADPNNKPLFDYTGFPLDGTANPVPGSSPGGSNDNTRGAWQIHDSAYATIDGLHIKGAAALNEDAVAGLRFVKTDHFTARRCIFENNYNGMQGSGTNNTIEYDEFVGNGRPGSDQQHQFYDVGGDNLTLRFNYFHAMCNPCGQNIHTRSWHTFLYGNWMQDASQYEWDMMTPDPSYPAPADHTMRQQFYGNVVVTNPKPGNETKVFTFSGDGAGFASGTMNLDAQWNTFWVRGQIGSGPNLSYNLFQLNVKPSLGGVNLHYANNILHFTGNLPCCSYQFSLYFTVGTSPWSISGDNNWFDNFVINTCSTPNGPCQLTNSTTSSRPPFNNINALDLRPANGNHPFGLADITQPLKPPYQQYPAGTVNLTALINYADVGALQYATELAFSPCDVNQDGVTNVGDVQLETNAALGVIACAPVYDIDKNGVCSIADVQRTIVAALGGQCVGP